MSKQIDERVVEMRFDNSQFEKNVSTTMSTLEKLKQSLNLTGAAKGFEDINSAVKKVDMNGLAGGVDNVSLKFNALYSVADQTLRNITTRVQHTAEQMVKSLTIQPISTGFNEYELKMGSIQTIMASTGESLETVNQYLNELNEYSDKTIYSFSDMTTNIGKFTNAGVKLEDAVLAIKGISNEAAVSGANANEASRAMYNFAQALSAGYVKLIDWKSIENANMATVEFKNYLLEAAEAAGTLEKQTNGMYKVLSTNAQGSSFDQLIDSTHYFNDSLNYQWMTTEALVSTLKAYADETTDIGKKAYASAQDIKTFTQMMDTLKESAQSGWAQTWELIVGDFEEAKNLWTTVGKVVGDMIEGMSKSRNDLLKPALSSGWDEMLEKMTEMNISADDLQVSMRKVLESHGQDVDALVKKHGSLEEAFRKESWGLEYLKEAFRGLNTELEDLSGIRDSLKFGASGDDVKKIQKALKDAGYQCGEFGDALDGVDGKLGKVTENAIKAFQEANGLNADGIIGPETLKALEEANKKTKILDKTIDELTGSFDKLGGRELLIEGLKNVFESLRRVIEIVKESWANVFDGFKSSDVYNLIQRFHDFTETLKIESDTADRLANTFEGLFTVLKVVKDVVVSVISTGVKLVWSVFKPLVNVLLSTTSVIGKFITSAGNMTSKIFKPMGEVISAIIDIVAELAEAIGTNIAECISKLGELEFIQTIGDWFSDSADAVAKGIESIKTHIAELGGNRILGAIAQFGSAIDSINSWWANFEVSDHGREFINNITAPFRAVWDWLTGFELPKFSFDNFAKSFNKFVSYLASNNYTGVFGGIKGTFAYIKSQLEFKWTTLKNNTLADFADFYIKYGEKIKAGFDACKNVIASVIGFVFGTEKLTVSDILDLAEKILTIAILIKTLNIVKDISGSLDSIATAFENIGAGIKWRAVGAAFLSLAAAIGAFAICLKIVSTIRAEDASRSLAILLAALTVMGAIVGGLLFLSSKLNGSANLLSTTFSMLAITLALGVLVYALKSIDGTEFKNLKTSFVVLTGVLLSLMLAMSVLGKVSGAVNLGSVAALLTFLVALKQVLDILDLYATYHWGEVLHAIPTMAAMLVGLAFIVKLASSGVKANASTAGLGFLLLAIVVSLKMLIGVISEFGEMPIDVLKQGIAVTMVVLAGVTAMLMALNATSKVTKLDKGQRAISGFAGLATALLAVAGTIAILGNLPTDVLIKGGTAVTLILGLFTAMMVAMGHAMRGTTKLGKITGMIIGMGLIIAELAVIMYLLRDLDGNDALAKFAGISAVLVTMAGCLRILTKHQNGAKNIYKWIGAMMVFGLVVAELAFILKSLQGVDGANAVGQFAAVSLMLFAMGLVLEKLSGHYRIKSANIYKWVGAMAVFGLVVGELGFVLKSLQGVDGMNAVSQFTAISLMLVAMASCIRILSFIGPAASGALPALGTLAIFATGLVAFLSILGGIDKVCKGGFADVMTRAVDIMTKIGQAIGGLVGGVLEGIGKGLTAALPQMGKDLSDFMTSAGAFFDGLRSIDSTMVTNTMAMVASLAELSKLAGTNGIDNFFSIGRSLPNLGSDLSEFMANASGFFDELASIKTDTANATRTLAEAVGILAEASHTSSWTFGDGLGTLGDQLVPFGEDMVAFSQTISGKIDSQAVEAAAAAAGVMAELNAKLPKEYGAISGLFKSESIPLDTFGTQLVTFGKAMVAFSSTVKGNIDSDAVAATKDAAQMMSDLNATLPKEYGAISGLFKSESIQLDTFGGQLVLFGRAMASFSAVISNGEINKDAIAVAKDAGSIMSELANSLPKEPGGIAAWFKDSPISLDTFGGQLVMFGRAIVAFSTTVKTGVDQTAVEAAATAGSTMAAMADTLPEETTWIDKWFGSGSKMSMATFADQLVKFGDAIVSFSESVSGSIDTYAIKTAVSVATDMVKMASDLPDNIDLTVLKTGLTDLAEAMVSFSESVSGNVDNTTITTVVTAAKTLAQAAAIMPDEVDLSKVTNGLGDFAAAIVDFSGKVSGISDDGSVATATKIGKDVASMLATIPTEIDPTNFIQNLGSLGTALVDFSKAVTGSDETDGINLTSISTAETACTYIGNMLTSLSVWSDISGFIYNAKSLAQAIVDFSKTVSANDAINSEAINAAATAGMQIGNMIMNFTIYTDLTGFIENAKNLAQAIVNFSKTVSGDNAIDTAAVNAAVNVGHQISDLLGTIQPYQNVQEFADGSAALAKSLINFSDSVSDGINYPAIKAAKAGCDEITKMLESFSGISGISEAVTTINDLGTTIQDFSKTVAEADMTGLKEDSDAFKRTVESFGNLSKSGVEAFIKNLEGAKPKAISSVFKFCNELLRLPQTYVWKFQDVGSDLVAGFALGITSSTWRATIAASAMASAALAAAKAALRVNSPSKEFYSLGESAGEGFTSAFIDYEYASSKAGATMAKAALVGLGDALTMAKDFVENGIDTQPTIRPVLDLSGLTEDASKITNLFNTSPSVGVMANVGAISRGMSYGQNGNMNDGIISAIDKLSEKMDNIRGDTYSINGITYNDGTELSDAIQTIVRYAKIERRV